MKTEPHVPTVIGIVILLIGMLATIFLIENSPVLSSQATGSNTVKEIVVANISDTNFSVGWLTDNFTVGYIKYWEKGNSLTERLAYDDRDQNNKPTPHTAHLVTVPNLKSNTTYQFTLVSNNKNAGKNYLVTTYPTLSASASTLKPAYGQIVYNQKPAGDVLVISDFGDTQIMVVATDDNGSWMMPLNLIRVDSGSNYYNFKNKQGLALKFLGINGQSTVKFLAENASPLPVIRLGENYDFTQLKSNLLKLLITPVYAASTNTNLPFKVIFPTPNLGISTDKPVFKGTGAPLQKVIISLNGQLVLSQQVTILENGTWSFVPQISLPPGKYSAAFIYNPKNAKTETVGLNFMILKSGTSVLGDATPAASLTPSLVPSIKASPSATISALVTGNVEPTLIVLISGALITFFGVAGLLKKNYN